MAWDGDDLTLTIAHDWVNANVTGAIPVVTTGAQGLFPPPQPGETNGTPVVLNSRSYTFTDAGGLPITTDLSDSKIQILPAVSSSALETANQHICSWLFTVHHKQHSLPAGVPCTFTFVAEGTDVNIDENPEVLLPSPHTFNVHVAPWEAVDGFFYNVEDLMVVVQSKFVVPGTPGVETTSLGMEWVGIPTPAFSPTSTTFWKHPTTIATVTADENSEATKRFEGLKTLPAFTQANKSGVDSQLLYTVSDAQRRGKAMVLAPLRKEAMGPLSIDATKGYHAAVENKHDVEVGRDAATGRLVETNVEHAKRLGAVKQLLEQHPDTETELYIGYVKTGSSRAFYLHAKVENGTPKYVMDVIQLPTWYIDLSAAFPTNHQNRKGWLVYVTEEVDLRFGSSTYTAPNFSGPTESVVIAGVETADSSLDYVYCGGIAMSSSDFVASHTPVSPAYLAHRDQVMLHTLSNGTWTRSSAPHGIGRMAHTLTLRQIGDLGALNYGVGLRPGQPTLVSVDGTQFGLYLPHLDYGLNYATLGEITGGKTRLSNGQVTFPAAILALFDFYNTRTVNNVNVLDIYYFTLKPTTVWFIGIGTATPLTLAQVACTNGYASEFILAANNAGKALFSQAEWDKMKQMIIDGAPAGAAFPYHNVSGTFTIHADRLTLFVTPASPGTELNGWYCTGPETNNRRVVDSTTYENLSQMCHTIEVEFDPNTTYSGKAGYGPTLTLGANSRLIWLSQPRTRLVSAVMLNQGRGSIYELGMAYHDGVSWYEYLSCDYNFTARSFSQGHAGDRDLMPYVTITTLEWGEGQANNRTFATSQDKYIVADLTTVRYNGGAEIGIPSRIVVDCSSMTITLEGADRFPIAVWFASTTGQTINFKQWVSSSECNHAIGVDGLNFRVGLTPTQIYADASAKWNSARNFVHGHIYLRRGQKRSDTDVLVAPVSGSNTFVADVLTGGMLTSGDITSGDYFVSMRSIALDELNLDPSTNDLIVCNERVYLLRTVLGDYRNGNAAGVITTAPWVAVVIFDGTIDHAKHHRVVKVQSIVITGTDAMICLGSDGAYYQTSVRYRPAGMSAYPGVNLVGAIYYAYADVSPSNTLENMQHESGKVYSLRNGSNGNPPGDFQGNYEGYTKNQTWQKGLARLPAWTVGGSSYGNNNFLPIPGQGFLLEQKIDTLNDKIATLSGLAKLWDAIDTTSDKMVTSPTHTHTIADLDNVPYASTSVRPLEKPVTNALRTVLSGKALRQMHLTLTAADFGIEKMNNTDGYVDDTYTVNGKGFVLDSNAAAASTAISQKAVTDLKNKLELPAATTTVQGLFAITNLSACDTLKIYGSGKETNKVYMNAVVKMYLTSVKILPANAYFKSTYDAGVLAPVYNSVYLVTPDISAGLNTLWVHSGKAGDKWGTKPLVLKADQDNNEPGIATEFQTTSGHVISMKGEKFIITSNNTLGDLLGRMRVLNNDAIT
ncbi:hypothetical protein SPFM1_00114 [Salmonella phage SPFM1]|nr:hypothetical protein SPFM1_00114 [Salmonella phage SPFM1]